MEKNRLQVCVEKVVLVKSCLKCKSLFLLRFDTVYNENIYLANLTTKK